MRGYDSGMPLIPNIRFITAAVLGLGLPLFIAVAVFDLSNALMTILAVTWGVASFAIVAWHSVRQEQREQAASRQQHRE